MLFGTVDTQVSIRILFEYSSDLIPPDQASEIMRSGWAGLHRYDLPIKPQMKVLYC